MGQDDGGEEQVRDLGRERRPWEYLGGGVPGRKWELKGREKEDSVRCIWWGARRSFCVLFWDQAGDGTPRNPS